MKSTHKKLLTSVTLFSVILLSTGCAPKNSDGSYDSRYSYHPYLQNKQVTNPLGKRVDTPKKYTSLGNIVSPNPVSSSRVSNNIEQIAKSLLGTDYQYGANGPHQYDCSSFTKYVFKQQGITIPRVSRDQAKKGQFVQANQLQKGDLIFFDSKSSTRVSHVGIYLGKGDFIHASSKQDKVTISNLSSNYYSKHFKWGRRVTNTSYAMR